MQEMTMKEYGDYLEGLLGVTDKRLRLIEEQSQAAGRCINALEEAQSRLLDNLTTLTEQTKVLTNRLNTLEAAQSRAVQRCVDDQHDWTGYQFLRGNRCFNGLKCKNCGAMVS